MFILDSLMISGIRWALETVVTAAEAEMNDDTLLREQLLEADIRRELHQITDAEFRAIEAELLARIREIRARRDGGSGPLAFADATPIETRDGERFNVEASLAGDFHATAPATTVADPAPRRAASGVRRRPRRKSVAIRPTRRS